MDSISFNRHVRVIGIKNMKGLALHGCLCLRETGVRKNAVMSCSMGRKARFAKPSMEFQEAGFQLNIDRLEWRARVWFPSPPAVDSPETLKAGHHPVLGFGATASLHIGSPSFQLIPTARHHTGRRDTVPMR